jgi:argininosuccinate synthase
VSGDVYVTLHPYRFELNGIHSIHDLMTSSFGSYGEVNKGWTAEEAKGFIKILSNAGKIATHVNQDHD